MSSIEITARHLSIYSKIFTPSDAEALRSHLYLMRRFGKGGEEYFYTNDRVKEEVTTYSIKSFINSTANLCGLGFLQKEIRRRAWTRRTECKLNSNLLSHLGEWLLELESMLVTKSLEAYKGLKDLLLKKIKDFMSCTTKEKVFPSPYGNSFHYTNEYNEDMNTKNNNITKDNTEEEYFSNTPEILAVVFDKIDDLEPQPHTPQPVTGLEKKELAVSSRTDSLPNELLVRMSNDYLKGLDAEYFPRNLTEPLGYALMDAFKRDKGAADRFLKLGPDVCKWMVWNTAYRMREEGVTQGVAVSGTVSLVARGTFGKPNTLVKHEIEVNKDKNTLNAAMRQDAHEINKRNDKKQEETELYRSQMTADQNESRLKSIMNDLKGCFSKITGQDRYAPTSAEERNEIKEQIARVLAAKLKNKEVENGSDVEFC